MKRFLLLCMSCFLLVSFSACGKTEKMNDESTVAGIEENKVLEKQEEKNNARVNQNTEEKNVENAESFTGENNTEENTGNEETPAENTEENTGNEEAPAENTEANANVPLDKDTDIYVGEYDSYDIYKPLEIAKNEDGTYIIQIQIYPLITLYQCVGEATDEGIAFSTTEWDGKDFSGLITVEGNDAIVRFTSSDWAEFTDIDTVYRYYKISGVPNIKNEN